MTVRNGRSIARTATNNRRLVLNAHPNVGCGGSRGVSHDGRSEPAGVDSLQPGGAERLVDHLGTARAMACWTCPALGLSDRCNIDTNSASDRTALMLR